MQVCRHGVRSSRSLRPSSHVLLQRRRFHLQADLLDDLQSRGLISDITRPDMLREELRSGNQVVYAGIDPTAPSLHVGHLLPLLSLFHFQIRGHQIIPLIGGATGLIGDPSGRSTERPLSAQADVERNVLALIQGVRNFFSGAVKYAQNRLEASTTPILSPDIRNNIHWTKDLGLLEFLRTVGVHSRVNIMMARDSVRNRLTSQQGISFTEFTYQLLQSYDFLMLYKNAGCTIQIGGSDQWGNIIAGIDLINRVNATDGAENRTEKGFGIVTPLLTTASGEKFGKSAGNAISLDEQATNVFDFYQFFLRSTDADVGRYLKIFTLLPLAKIESVLEDHASNPETRLAQRLLAQEVTELVHGETGVRRAQAATAVLYDQDFSTLNIDTIIESLHGMPFFNEYEESEMMNVPIAKLAARCQIASSNGAARQLVAAKGLYLNNHPVSDPQQALRPSDLIGGRLAIIRAGKQKQAVVALSHPLP
ncbi:Tyrosine--tRNA ligase, mitochondrial [Sparassis crispa]|uniref:Tyrosine--tRNA ligase n=1 Tax=Sparassis crispa TaxID=139825 RepID=A0A401GFQ8_9APHY|nr:Tyrosine--tRNA ligase, mitochondrial [Sparassis crispa]GBE81010.1 Tyrosine--tRNA ligase, mitochondrial [Sparassis crispa]